MTKEKLWFLIYFLVEGKSRRYFCKGSGAWRHAETCGAYTFTKVSESEDNETVECTQGHNQTVPKGYNTLPHQTEGGLF